MNQNNKTCENKCSVKFYLKNILDFKIKNKSIQLIYLDPPFNSNRDYKLSEDNKVGFKDKWNKDEDYSQFIDKVINHLLPSLKKNGSLLFHISSSAMYIPESILRKYFKFVNPIFWKKCRSKNNVKNKLGSTIDIIFQCSNIQKPKFNIIYQEKDTTYLKESFKNNDERGNYALGHLVTEKTKKGYIYSITINETEYNPKSGWRISKEKLEDLIKDNRIHFPSKKEANLYKKIYLHENPGKPCTDLWDDIHSISQGNELRKYPTAKPIKLLERIISIYSDENDIILDPMCGSGTTGVACYNLNRNCLLLDKNPQVIDIINSRIPNLHNLE